MSLYYPELDKEKTRKVFELNLDLIKERFEQQNRKVTYDKAAILDSATKHFRKYKYSWWNGRQIRNACQTALALAEYDAHGGEMDGGVEKNVEVTIHVKYFETVQKAYLDFSKYLGDIRGPDGDRRAIDRRLRAQSGTPYQAKPRQFDYKRTETESDSEDSDSDDESDNETQRRNRRRKSRRSARNDRYQSPTSQSQNLFQPLAEQARQSTPMGVYGRIPTPGQQIGSPGYAGQQVFQSPQGQVYQGHPQMSMSQGWGGANTNMGFTPNAQLQQGQSYFSGKRPQDIGGNFLGQNRRFSPHGFTNMAHGSQDTPGYMGHVTTGSISCGAPGGMGGQYPAFGNTGQGLGSQGTPGAMGHGHIVAMGFSGQNSPDNKFDHGAHADGDVQQGPGGQIPSGVMGHGRTNSLGGGGQTTGDSGDRVNR